MRIRRIFEIGILAVGAMLVAPVGVASASLVKAAPMTMKASVPNANLYGNEPPNPSANLSPVPNFAPSEYANSVPVCYQSGAAAQQT